MSAQFKQKLTWQQPVGIIGFMCRESITAIATTPDVRSLLESITSTCSNAKINSEQCACLLSESLQLQLQLRTVNIDS